MQHRSRSSLLAAAAVAALILAETRAQEPDTREFISYLWTSGIDGRAGIGDRVGDVDASFDDLADFVDVGGTARFRSTSDPYGWFVEGTYIRLSNTADTLPVAARVEFTRRLGELGVTRTLSPRLSGYLGLRAQELDTELRTADGQMFGAGTNVNARINEERAGTADMTAPQRHVRANTPSKSAPWIGW